MVGFSEDFFKRVEKKTNVDKNTIFKLAEQLQHSNMKDEGTLRNLIQEIGQITGKEVSKEKEDKIIKAVISDKVPKDFNKFVD